jgi:hypothetical protein
VKVDLKRQNIRLEGIMSTEIIGIKSGDVWAENES